jgi:NADH:ubiquinone oxidoreductase subunit H
MIGVALLTLLEQSLVGYIRVCRDPNKVWFLGIFQPFIDAVKLFSRK